MGLTPSVLFIGIIADKATIELAFRKEKMPQVSAVDFQKGILEALTCNGIDPYIISSLPIATYPSNKTIFISGHEFTLSCGVKGRLMGFVNFPFLKLACRVVTTAWFGAKQLRSNPQASAIIVYSIHLPYLTAALLLKRVFNIPVAAFINDLPMYMAASESKGLFAGLKQLETRLSQKLMQKVDLALPVSPKTAEDWLPTTTKYLVVEGIAAADAVNCKPYPKAPNPRPRVLYAGTLSYVANFAQLFARSKDVDADLVFAGNGPDAEVIADLARLDSRISLLPFLRGEEFEAQIERADFLLNARDSSWPGGKYSFAFKLFEYMARGRPILSTRLGSISEEFFECFLEVDDSSVSAFESSIKKALSEPSSELVRRVKVGLEIVAVRKSPENVGRKIIDALGIASAAARSTSLPVCVINKS